MFVAEHQVRQLGDFLRDMTTTATKARSNATAPVPSVIRPALECLEDIINAPSDDELPTRQDRLKRLIVALALKIGPNVRACLYEMVPAGSVRSLRCDSTTAGTWLGSAGRVTPPREEFRDDASIDLAGTDKFQMIDQRETILVKDVDQEPPRGLPAGRDYKTFIASTVASGDEVFGFLGVDSTNPGDLTEADMHVVRELARILAIGLRA